MIKERPRINGEGMKQLYRNEEPPLARVDKAVILPQPPIGLLGYKQHLSPLTI
jgi:hypothetical protein